jgi:hypothetical protein
MDMPAKGLGAGVARRSASVTILLPMAKIPARLKSKARI